MKDYKVLPLKTEDKTETINLIRKFFLKGDPLNDSVGLSKNKPSNPEMEAICLSSLGAPINFKAVSADGKIIAVKLNHLESRANVGKKMEINEEINREIFKFLEFVEEKADVFGKYPKVDKILCGFVLVVDPSWRRRGIGRELMEKTWEATCEQNCGLMKVLATSIYTAKTLSRMECRCIYSLNYGDYAGHEGIKNNAPPPHTAANVFVKENVS